MAQDLAQSECLSMHKIGGCLHGCMAAQAGDGGLSGRTGGGQVGGWMDG